MGGLPGASQGPRPWSPPVPVCAQGRWAVTVPCGGPASTRPVADRGSVVGMAREGQSQLLSRKCDLETLETPGMPDGRHRWGVWPASGEIPKHQAPVSHCQGGNARAQSCVLFPAVDFVTAEDAESRGWTTKSPRAVGGASGPELTWGFVLFQTSASWRRGCSYLGRKDRHPEQVGRGWGWSLGWGWSSAAYS